MVVKSAVREGARRAALLLRQTGHGDDALPVLQFLLHEVGEVRRLMEPVLEP
jgi:hypothetical protein